MTHMAALAALALPGQAPTTRTPPPVMAAQRDSLIFEGGPLEAEAVAIERTLRCNCGCGLDVHSCLFAMQCGTSPKWAERIRRELKAGKTPDAIKAGFVADFGQTVLMEPPATGFNLVGYLLPGVAILMVGTLVGLLVQRGARPIQAGVSADAFSDAELDRVREAMRRMDESQRPDW
jgi:cytochrome c-type biogenesis protein CcmH/NrfF